MDELLKEMEAIERDNLIYHARSEERRKMRAEIKRKKEERKYRIIQSTLGIVLALLGVGSVFIDYDITAAVFFIPLGLYVAFTKERVLDV
jgi:uncharacterized membrane protein